MVAADSLAAAELLTVEQLLLPLSSKHSYSLGNKKGMYFFCILRNLLL
ncbi:MAG: hypothetical protein GY696_22905 [Gammaproteobacteria bacterium]|nr:hypothetical protein [Gammaproteobacteria bacterium]